MDMRENLSGGADGQGGGMTAEQRLEHWKKVGEANAKGYGAKDGLSGTVEQQLELMRQRGQESARKYGVRACRTVTV